MTPTEMTYDCLQRAFTWFNAELWGGDLPECLITLQRKGKTYGYFAPSRFNGGTGIIHEIALNPSHFVRGEKDVMSTLVHEMVHLWRQGQAPEPKGGYHDKKWAVEMKRVGLWPSSTGAEGGKETGAKVSHYVVEDGMYDLSFLDMQLQPWFSRLAVEVWSDKDGKDKAARKLASKTKYTCPTCGMNAWAKPGAGMMCVDCDEELQPAH